MGGGWCSLWWLFVVFSCCVFVVIFGYSGCFVFDFGVFGCFGLLWVVCFGLFCAGDVLLFVVFC